jgi:hypothetical protein
MAFTALAGLLYTFIAGTPRPTQAVDAVSYGDRQLRDIPEGSELTSEVKKAVPCVEDDKGGTHNSSGRSGIVNPHRDEVVSTVEGSVSGGEMRL